MKVIRYETPNDEVTNLKGPVIFLAGPTVRGNQPHLTSWRQEDIEIYQRLGFQGTLILPEFTDKTESDKGRVELPIWEDNGLKRADCILFWICRTRELYGLNTNSEHGYWLAKDPMKLVYGRPDSAFRIQYNDIMWNKVMSDLNVKEPIHNDLESTIKASMIKAMEEVYKKAYHLYITEERKEADRLQESGCMVNYRELTYSDFKDVLQDENHRWFNLYGKVVNHYYDRVF